MPCRNTTGMPSPATESARRGRPGTKTVSRPLFRFGAGDLHRAGAACGILPDVRGEFRRRAAHDFIAFGDQLLLAELGLAEDLLRIGVEALDRGLRRAGGKEE